jgi:AcrR family transcriptional regulator
VTPRAAGLREQKKTATRKALRDAALRLALQDGPDNVRVDDIAEAAGVSPRTYNNYFGSREQAIVAAITAERESRIGAAVAARPGNVRLADAVTEAVVEQYTAPDENAREAILLVTTSPALRRAFIGATAAVQHHLAEAIAERIDDDRYAAQVLAASVTAAIQVALERWLQPAQGTTAGGLVVPSGSLPELLRGALAPLAPALDAAEAR